MRALGALALVALVTLGIHEWAPRVAHAQSSPENATRAEMAKAKRHFNRGEKLFALGRFDKALESYQRAFEAVALPEFLFNIGQCHRNLGDYEAAVFSFRKYLKLKPDAANRDSTEKLIDRLEEDIEKERRDRDRTRLLDPDVPKPGPEPKPHRDKSRPFYKHWAFWTGVAVVAVGATATAVVLSSGENLPSSDLGNLDFGR